MATKKANTSSKPKLSVSAKIDRMIAVSYTHLTLPTN